MQRKFLVFPSKKKPWYYIEKSNITLKFFVNNLLTSRYKSFNVINRFLSKIFFLDKLLLLFGYRANEIENLVKPFFSSLSLTNQTLIVRQTTWQRQNDKFTIFIFNGNAKKPALIAKCLSHQFSKYLETEFKNMKKVTRYFSNTELIIPQPEQIFTTEKYAVYLEEFCDGIALNDLGNREFNAQKRVAIYDHGLDVIDIITQKFIKFTSPMTSEIFEKYVEGSLQNFEKTSELIERYPHRFSALKCSSEKINHKHIVCMPMHGDLWGGSILKDDKQIAVIDWEFFQEKGMPFWDLFMFLVHPGFVFKGQNKGLFSEFRSFLDHKSQLNKINQILTKHAAKLNFNDGDIEFLFQTFLIYNCQTRDNATDRNWEKCLNYYWENGPLFSREN